MQVWPHFQTPRAKLVKNTPLRVVFSTLYSMFGNTVFVFDIILPSSHTSPLHHFHHQLTFLDPWRRTWQQAKQWKEKHMCDIAVSTGHQSIYFCERKQLYVSGITTGQNTFKPLEVSYDFTTQDSMVSIVLIQYLSTTTTTRKTIEQSTAQHMLTQHGTALANTNPVRIPSNNITGVNIRKTRVSP